MTGKEAQNGLHGARVLVVEDSFDVAEALEFMLETFGCIVVGPAANMTRALNLVRSETLDGAILDINLGDDRAFPIAEALRDRNVPFIFSTGYDSSVLPPSLANAPIVHKPYDLLVLKKRMEEAFAFCGVG